MFRHLPLMLKNSWRNRRRTILTILSIGVSLCLLGFLMAIYHAFYLSKPDQYSALRMVARNRVSLAVPLPQYYGERIKQLPGVREVSVNQWFGGIYIDEKHFFAQIATEPSKIFLIRPELSIPAEQKKAFIGERTACIAGRALAEKYNWHVGDRIVLKGTFFPVDLDLTLRGIYDAPIADDVLYFNQEYIEQGLPADQRGFIGTFDVLANSTDDVPRIEKAVDDMFRNSPYQTKTETESAFALSFVAFLGNVKFFLLSICAALTFTILLVSGNTIAMSVRERVREVGVLKTLGFTRGTILGIILGEAVMVCLVGGILGVGLASLLVLLARKGAIFLQQLQHLTIVLPVAAMCLGIAAMVGLVSAFVPAYNASRISIVEALRSEDYSMAIPLTYNFRNLIVRKTTTIMTAFGVALTVAVLLAVLAMVGGLKSALEATGDPLHVLVLRKGANSELVSNFSREGFQDIKFKAGVARGKSGEPLASLELVTVINLVSVDAPDGINLSVRGLSPVGIEMRKDVKLVAGRWFDTGKREVVIGESIAKRFPDAQLGKKLRFGTGDWEVVGLMSAGQSATNSEIFADLNQLSSDYRRSDVLSSTLLEATDSVSADALVKNLDGDQRLNVDAILEKDYYNKQTSSALPIESLGILVSVIMAVGSAFAAMNTMYAAVARRSKEIGTLRVLGFSRGSILASFFTESVLLAALGGLIGIVLVLPLSGATTGIGNFATFSETSFKLRVTPGIMLTGLAFAVALGAVGGLLPAWNAARKEVLAALRQV